MTIQDATDAARRVRVATRAERLTEVAWFREMGEEPESAAAAGGWSVEAASRAAYRAGDRELGTWLYSSIRRPR